LQALHSSHKALIQHHIDAPPIAKEITSTTSYVAYISIYTLQEWAYAWVNPWADISITLIQNPKRGPKVDQDPAISALPGAPSLIGCRSPKMVNYDQVFLETWSRANMVAMMFHSPSN
jgi:hypothetical protein